MASGDLVRYVITVMLHEDTLTEINELNNYLTRDGFLLTMTDDDGNIHELGTNTFGLISTQSEEEARRFMVRQLCAGSGWPVHFRPGLLLG